MWVSDAEARNRWIAELVGEPEFRYFVPVTPARVRCEPCSELICGYCAERHGWGRL